MLKLIRTVAALLLLLVLPFAAVARDLDKSDPVRKELLDAARGNTDDRFIVKYLIQNENLAYLCALKTDKSGSPYQTDEDIDIYSYLFVKHGNKWIAISTAGGLTAKYQPSDCEPLEGEYFDFFPDDLEGDALTLWSMWTKEAHRLILENFKDGQQQTDTHEAIAALRESGVLKSLPVDLLEKDREYLATGAAIVTQNCKKDMQCLANLRKSQAKLEEERHAKEVSSVAWNTCTEQAIYNKPFDKIEQCVVSFSKKRYCRPGMDLFADNADVKRCVSEITGNK